jgi:putative ABC transport system substrate-binding protein
MIVSSRQKVKSSDTTRPFSAKMLLLLCLLLAAILPSGYSGAQQAKIYRVGVILQGGPFYTMIDGLRDGLRDLGFIEGKRFLFEIRDTRGDLKAVDQAARSLELEKVNVLYTVATSVTIAARKATANIPIIFNAGTDPTVVGLVESFAKPGGRLTGVHFLTTDLTGKRLEILRDLLPKLHRAVMFYDPDNLSARESAKQAREAAQRLKVELLERHVTSVEDLHKALQALRSGEVDAYLDAADAMVFSQAQFVIDVTREKRLPTIFQEQTLIYKGGLASYGVSYHEVGRLSAKYIQRILTGTRPPDLAVETVGKIDLVLNLRTAHDIGLTIPPNVLARADRVIK